MKILAIETSADETAAAVVEDGTKIISHVVASSAAMHEKWGGIVPEVAARQQVMSIIPVIVEALQPFSHLDLAHTTPEIERPKPYKSIIEKNIDTLAITVGPGLIGSLLIGIETAKTIAYITGKPIIPVNHVLAHMYANFVDSSWFMVHGQSNPNNHHPSTINHQPITFPAISLVVSGGHTELFLMTSHKDIKWLGGTIDDAAGEAFDKTARLLGFGSRGGVAIQEAAAKVHGSEFMVHGQKRKIFKPQTINYKPFTIFKLPRPLLHDDTLNFSFSGLKTAILREVNKLKTEEQMNDLTIQQLAYETQEAITDVLVDKTIKATQYHSAKSILISGGVASNLRLREKFNQIIHDKRLTINFSAPPVSLCTDNAVYIASYAYFRGHPVDWHTLEAMPNLSVEVDS